MLWPGGVDVGIQSRLWYWLQLTGIPWLTIDVVQFAANVVLFTPLGLLIALMLPPGRRWLVVPGLFAASLAVELAQAFLLPVRIGDPLDVVANTIGAVLGALIARRVGRRAVTA